MSNAAHDIEFKFQFKQLTCLLWRKMFLNVVFIKVRVFIISRLIVAMIILVDLLVYIYIICFIYIYILCINGQLVSECLNS